MHFNDMLTAIALVEEFIGEMDLAAYTSDAKTKSAVERQLQIITEAAYRLTPEDEVLCLDFEPWAHWTPGPTSTCVPGAEARLSPWL